jgi:hypothetical protein
VEISRRKDESGFGSRFLSRLKILACVLHSAHK